MLDVVRRTAEACSMPLTVAAVCAPSMIFACCCDPAPTRFRSQRRGQPPRIRQGGGRKIRRSVHRGRDRRQRVKRDGGERWEIFTHGGRNSTASMHRNMPRKWFSLGAGEILLTSMDRDGTRQGFDIRLTSGVGRQRSGAGDRIRRRRPSRSPGGRYPPRMRPRLLAASDFPLRRIYHTGSQGPYGPAGLPMRLDP